MTDKKRIEMLERENKRLKINNKFLSNYSRVLAGFVLEDIKIRTEQANQEVQEFMKKQQKFI